MKSKRKFSYHVSLPKIKLTFEFDIHTNTSWSLILQSVLPILSPFFKLKYHYYHCVICSLFRFLRLIPIKIKTLTSERYLMTYPVIRFTEQRLFIQCIHEMQYFNEINILQIIITFINHTLIPLEKYKMQFLSLLKRFKKNAISHYSMFRAKSQPREKTKRCKQLQMISGALLSIKKNSQLVFVFQEGTSYAR